MIQVSARGDLSKKQQSKAYEPVNGCTRSLSLWQVVAIGVMTAIQILSFDLIRSMIELQSLMLYILFGVSYFFLVIIIIDYFILLFHDPADPRVKNNGYSEPNQKLKKCSDCKINVDEKSYHCRTCERCVQGFDHHCVFLNNCIGKQNYSIFLRLLVTLIVHTSVNMGIGLSMYVQLNDAFRWVALAYSILSFIVFVEIAVLAIFHCYISFILFKSTLQVMRGDSKIDNSQSKPRKLEIEINTVSKCETKPVENTLPQQRTEVDFRKHSIL